MRKYLRILHYFSEDAWQIVLSLALIGLSTLLGLLWGFPLAILIDVEMGQKQDQWLYMLFYNMTPMDSGLARVLFLAGLMLAVRLGSEFLRMWQSILSIRIGLHGMMRVRCDLFRKLQTLSIGYHRSQPQGDAIYRVAWDTYGFQGVLNVLVAILVASCKLVLMVVIAWSFNWKLTLLSLVVIPPLLAVLRAYGNVLKTRSIEAKEKDSGFYTVLQRSMTAIGLVQAFGREADEYRKFDSTVRGSIKAYYNLHWHEVLYWLFIGTTFAVGSTIVFGFGGHLVIEKVLTVGSLTIILAYIGDLYDPLTKLSSSGASMISAMAGVNRVFEVLDREELIKDAPGAKDLPRQPRTFKLDRVAFAYRAGENVLQDLSVEMKPGEMIGFVGSSGVGKTTLLNLFPRFYDPTGGSLSLDGNDLRTITLKSLRAHIALVLQESIILPTTIAENISYGRPNSTLAEVKAAAVLAGAAAFIEKMPDKYDTLVNEGGSNLSGGQRQRIAIARALLTEAPIIVMDEPTSALDAEHEQYINETLRDLKGKRTIIIVSHRLSTVADCDRICVLDAGHVIEAGTHKQLIELKGAYYRMARHQMKIE